jgi:hypothetical protein
MHTMQDTLDSLVYQTPNGKVDVPYVYVYDGSVLTNGAAYNKLGLLLDPDSDFILRRVASANQVAASFRLYYPSQRYVMDKLVNAKQNWPVLPEILYGAGSQIPFDLGVVAKSVVADTVPIPTSFIYFCGVRRFNTNAFPIYRTPYNYREVHKEYEFALNLNYSHWTGASNGVATMPVQYLQQITEGDFELCQIRVTQYATGARLTNDSNFAISLFDPRGQFRLMSAPVLQAAIDANSPAAYYQPCFPVPSMVYPVNGAIKFEIQSMLPFGSTGQYVIQFVGIERRPL